MSADSDREPTLLGGIASQLLEQIHDPTRIERAPVVRRPGLREPIPLDVRRLIHHRDRWRCIWCGWNPFTLYHNVEQAERMLHLDHIVPWSAGGSDRTDNLRTLCSACNEKRSNERADMGFTVVKSIVHYCEPCIIRAYELHDEDLESEILENTTMPALAVAVFCGRRKHISWTTLRHELL